MNGYEHIEGLLTKMALVPTVGEFGFHQYISHLFVCVCLSALRCLLSPCCPLYTGQLGRLSAAHMGHSSAKTISWSFWRRFDCCHQQLLVEVFTLIFVCAMSWVRRCKFNLAMP